MAGAEIRESLRHQRRRRIGEPHSNTADSALSRSGIVGQRVTESQTDRFANIAISPSASLGDDRDGVDLDEIVGRGHLADLDHGGGGRGRAKIFAPHFVDVLEMLHVADVDVDAADVVHAAAGLLDRGLQILADLARLRFDVADAGDRAIGPPRGHTGNEEDAAARLDHGRVGKMAGRLADFRRRDLLLGHARAPGCESGHQPAGRMVCNISGCAPALISMRTFRYCQSLRLRSSWGIPGSRQIASPGFSCVSRTRPSSNVISFLPSVSGTRRYGSRCWCHGWRWPGSSVTPHTRTTSFSNTILSPIGPNARIVAVSPAMIRYRSAPAWGCPTTCPYKSCAGAPLIAAIAAMWSSGLTSTTVSLGQPMSRRNRSPTSNKDRSRRPPSSGASLGDTMRCFSPGPFAGI